MTDTEVLKLRHALWLLAGGRANDAREEIEELVAASGGQRPGLLSLRTPDRPAPPVLGLLEGLGA